MRFRSAIIRTLGVLAVTAVTMAGVSAFAATTASATTVEECSEAREHCTPSQAYCQEIGYDHPDCGEPPCEYTQSCPPPEQPVEPQLPQAPVTPTDMCADLPGIQATVSECTPTPDQPQAAASQDVVEPVAAGAGTTPDVVADAAVEPDASSGAGRRGELPFTGATQVPATALALVFLLTGGLLYAAARRSERPRRWGSSRRRL